MDTFDTRLATDTSRRRFLGRAALGGAGLVAAPALAQAQTGADGRFELAFGAHRAGVVALQHRDFPPRIAAQRDDRCPHALPGSACIRHPSAARD